MTNKNNYYQGATDWAYDLYHSQTVWLRRTLVALIFLGILLFMSLCAMLLLFPLKEKVPYLYAFNQATGEIAKVGTLEPTTLSANWELSRYLLIHYVINRESYDYDNIETAYQMAWAQSIENVRKQYEEQVKSSSVHSPYHLYGKDKYITVRVLSVNQLNDKTVDVKFEKTLHDRALGSQQITQKEAIIKWEFAQSETTEKMLERDPLGFKVTYYQVSQVNLNNNL